MRRSRCDRRSTSLVLIVTLLATVAFPPAEAAPLSIIWGSAQTISGDSDVSTTGSLVYAFTFGGTSAPPAATVNGVTFSPFTVPGGFVTSATSGNVVISEAPGTLFAYNTFGTGSAPFSGLSSGYQTLLGSGAYADTAANITVMLGGLTNGQQYQVQWWTNNSANLVPFFGEGGFTNTTASSGTSSVTLTANTTGQLGGLGQYAIGTFTASGTAQSFLLAETSGGFNPLINALQVRAVPEPSTSALALAGIAWGGYSMWRRRRRA